MNLFAAEYRHRSCPSTGKQVTVGTARTCAVSYVIRVPRAHPSYVKIDMRSATSLHYTTSIYVFMYVRKMQMSNIRSVLMLTTVRTSIGVLMYVHCNRICFLFQHRPQLIDSYKRADWCIRMPN